mmetsp:Transcript_2948/g.5638  ORF Transcript_2948/g.5638 Transcript_2948/m.5638 type:complete len:203 (+) Transcript_2948:410-1018(+)
MVDLLQYPDLGQLASRCAMDHFVRGHAPIQIGADATRLATEPNAGGGSVVSESLSMEVLARKLGARDVLSEMAIQYWSPCWKKVDYICTIGNQRVGVSVTRAMHFKDPNSFDAEDARALLHKKVNGLVIARAGVSEQHQYTKSVLHAWCQTRRIAEFVQEAFAEVEKTLSTEDNMILLLTVAENAPYIFADDPSVLGVEIAP